ncbi:MAG: hypothetical protein HZA03_06260 [Nitrospinae bacterium]|nr:hypothetical protein [Nitrospinota bacterium]
MGRRIMLLLLVVAVPFTAFAKTPAPFKGAAACGACHQDHYDNWKNSLHALSYGNPIFQAAYQKAYAETAGKAAQICLPCHAPTARITGDYAAKDEITREGITCDFCHSVEDVKKGKFVLKTGDVKRSALKESAPKEHGAAYGEAFATSRLCSGCHDFTNHLGAKVGNTYDEWKKSQYMMSGVHCQNCHMAEMPGRSAKENGRNSIHDHSLAHSMEKMLGAVRVETKEPVRMNDAVLADVLLVNEGAGHAIPTGTPARTLVLEVRAMDAAGNVVEVKKKVYRKRILDGKGNEMLTDGDAFLHGKKVSSDNRLLPGESRVETFRFAIRPKNIAKVAAEVYLSYQPVVITKTEMKIPLSSAHANVK